ncbi:hypothetical protein E6W17_36680 [Streptomyces sp. A1547]|nr:hypothetical protein E6W17_36680 [Streptomyces sp. A1547]
MLRAQPTDRRFCRSRTTGDLVGVVITYLRAQVSASGTAGQSSAALLARLGRAASSSYETYSQHCPRHVRNTGDLLSALLDGVTEPCPKLISEDEPRALTVLLGLLEDTEQPEDVHRPARPDKRRAVSTICEVSRFGGPTTG